MKLALSGAWLGILLCFHLPAAFAQPSATNHPPLTPAEQEFIRKAAGGGLGEVKLGQLAEQKATNPEVKRFARRMIEDHAKANGMLKAALSLPGVTAPSTIAAEAQQAYDRLSRLSGREFDRAYVEV